MCRLENGSLNSDPVITAPHTPGGKRSEPEYLARKRAEVPELSLTAQHPDGFHPQQVRQLPQTRDRPLADGRDD
mgnify:CR=1 FL=1